MGNITPTKRFLSFLYNVIAMIIQNSLLMGFGAIILFYTDQEPLFKFIIFIIIYFIIQSDMIGIYRKHYKED